MRDSLNHYVVGLCINTSLIPEVKIKELFCANLFYWLMFREIVSKEFIKWAIGLPPHVFTRYTHDGNVMVIGRTMLSTGLRCLFFIIIITRTIWVSCSTEANSDILPSVWSYQGGFVINNVSYKCSMCCFSGDSFQRLTDHVVRLHRHDPNFVVHCEIGNCAYTSKSWGAYKCHVSRKHRAELGPRGQIPNMPVNNENLVGADYADDAMDAEEYHENQGVLHDIQTANCNVSFCLALQSRHGLTQCSINEVIDSAASLVQLHVGRFKRQIWNELTTRGIDVSFLNDINTDTLLGDMNSCKKRDSFYEKQLHSVPSAAVKLGEKYITMKGKITKRDINGYIVPFKNSLVSLIRLVDVFKYMYTRAT